MTLGLEAGKPDRRIRYVSPCRMLWSDVTGRNSMPIRGTNRRAFIAALGGVAAWPLMADGQTSDQTRRIGVLLNLGPDDPETRARLTAFLEALRGFGWSEGRNLQIDYRWGMGDTNRHRTNAAEIIALAPDVILVHGSTIMAPVQRLTQKVPIVFVSVADPIAGGFVDGLSRPGGNATGFTSSDYGTAGKWLELLKQAAPEVTRRRQRQQQEQERQLRHRRAGFGD
jgi:putative tryptophan/tyrosine transport system substrate-binding protein